MLFPRDLAIAALALALAGGGATAAAQQANSARTAKGSPYDAQIQTKISQELGKKDKFKDVHATVDDQIVTLTGTVRDYADKEDADRRAHRVEHAEGVRNQIQVAGPSISDADLQQRLEKKLRYDRIGYGAVYNALGVNVQDGVVTLNGKVRTDTDKASALAVVENEPGVRGVVDDVEVLPTSINDDEIRLAVARAIYGDSTLSRYAMDPQAPIRIVVDNGHVTLYGTVENAMDKNLAGIRANSVPNVFSVDNKLQVANEKVK